MYDATKFHPSAAKESRALMQERVPRSSSAWAGLGIKKASNSFTSNQDDWKKH
jgi:hypothetical protein